MKLLAILRAGLPILCLLLAAKSSAQVVGANDSGFHIRVEVEVPVDRERAWEQFTHPERWWNEDHSWFGKRGNFSLDPVAGGCLCETEGDASADSTAASGDQRQTSFQ